MKIGVLGCGKMCSAMIARWLDSHAVEKHHILAMTKTVQSAARVHQNLGVQTCTSSQQLISWADVVLVGIKPQQVATVLPPLKALVPSGQLWMSVMAGVRSETIAEMTGAKVIRLMPNTPVRLGLGATGVVWPSDIAPPVQNKLRGLLQSLGVVIDLHEEQLDAFTALAGSGPAYVFYFIEALQAAGQSVGLSDADARELSLSVVQGASALLASGSQSALEHRLDVTSPGGMTEAAIGHLQQVQWSNEMSGALAAALHRANQLAQAAASATDP
ncbi:MAG TPA: pyrroline-5-carboxylate reductase [Myxococcales bacterium]|nr:pyrroline-5-carboxylate reductase [Myxococcales bacterium]HAN31648.1 pyrroline-5-carboxylate reductase [Myxococcales bacterium]